MQAPVNVCAQGYGKANAHSSSSSNGMSSIVFQAFIFPFERSKEGAELSPWLVECFFGRRGMKGEGELHKANSCTEQMVVCSCLSMASTSRAHPRANSLSPLTG